MKRFLTVLPILAAAVAFYLSMPLQNDTQVKAAYVAEIVPQVAMVPEVQQEVENTGTPSNGTPSTTDVNNNKVLCSSLPEAQGGVLLGAIVPCITHTIEVSTTKFSQQMIDWLQPVYFAFLTLVIVLFGVKALQGEKQIGPQTLMLLVKITLVTTIFTLIPNTIVPVSYQIIDQGVTIISGAIDDDTNNLTCPIALYGGPNTPTIWKELDCVLGKLYGFTTGQDQITGQKTPNMLLASSAFGLMTGFFFGGTLGVAVFFAMIGVFLSLMLLVLRVTMAFLNGYMTVCVLLIIAPLFLPLIFLKITTDYFEKWWKAILGGLLMPMVVAAYAIMALIAYDDILFKPDSKMQMLFNNKAVQTATEQATAACSMPVTGNPQFQLKQYVANINKTTAYVDDNADPVTNNKMMKMMLNNPFTRVFANPLLSAGNNGCGPFKMQNFDVTKVNASLTTGTKDPKWADKKKAMTDLFLQAVELLLMTWLISAGMKLVEDTLANFSAGSSIGQILLQSPSNMTNVLKRGYGTLQSSMSQNIGNESGSAFLRKMPGATVNAMSESTGTFLGNIRK